MSAIRLQLPESLYDSARELARKENISLDQLITLALAEKMSALLTEEIISARARRGDRIKYERVLAKAPDVEPDELDRL